MKSTSKLTTWKSKLLPFAVVLTLAGVRTAHAVDYPSTILADHPAAYYRLEEVGGSGTATDSTGNGFNGAINYDYDIDNNPDYPLLGQPGLDTNSYVFHSYTDTNFQTHVSYVDVASSSTLNPQGPFSVEFWARATSDANNYDVPVGSVGGTYPQPGWDFYQTPGTPGSWVFNVPTAGAFIQTSQVIKNQWTHLVGVYDGTSLIFYVNGVATATVSGAGYLANNSANLAVPGDLTIGFNQSSGWGAFEGYLDEVAIYTNALSASQILAHYEVGTNSFSTNAAPPVVLMDAGSTSSNPQSIAVNAGSTATFDPIVIGGLPLSYLWYTNGVAETDATNALLSFSASSADNGSTYFVVVTNNYGSSTSQVATLTVAGVLFINSDPQSIARYVGSYAAFHVTASGALPITYKWSLSTDNGATFNPIVGATNETLWLSNVQMAQSGYEYEVLVTGPVLSSTPPAATLIVQPRPINVPLTGYAALVAADKPVALWQLNDSTPVDGSTAVDAVGSFNGTYTPNTVNGGSITGGITGGIPHDTNTAVKLSNLAVPGFTPGATVQIPWAPELNPDIPWSVETWIQPNSISGSDYRVVLSSEYNVYPNPYSGWYIYQQPSQTFSFVPQPGNQFITVFSPTVVANNWYHLVVTDDGSNFNFYINGVLAVAPFPVAGANYIPNGDGINPDGSPQIGTPPTGNFVLGQRTDNAFNAFDGNMQDTAVYNYALTPQQIQNHYLNQILLTITRSGNNVILSWPAGTGTLQYSTSVGGTYSNINGATPPYTNIVNGATMFYRLLRQ
jgi:Concanavalin A-like lectin/glucanases superfamily